MWKYLALCSLLLSCATRFQTQCEAPAAYRYKPVATILKEAKQTVSRPGEKRAIVFSVYGSIRKYTIGLLENIEIAKDQYPGWDVVVFIDEDSVPKDIIEDAKRRGAVLKLGKYRFAASRFFVADLDYDRFISRDSDSRIYPREVAAVADWMQNDWAYLHNMRDSKIQVNPVLGGMWGAVVKPLRARLAAMNNGESNIEKLYTDWINKKGGKAVYGDDELFLKEVVLKAVGEDHFITHESFRCNEFLHSNGFPIPRGSAGIHIGGIREVD